MDASVDGATHRHLAKGIGWHTAKCIIRLMHDAIRPFVTTCYRTGYPIIVGRRDTGQTPLSGVTGLGPGTIKPIVTIEGIRSRLAFPLLACIAHRTRVVIIAKGGIRRVNTTYLSRTRIIRAHVTVVTNHPRAPDANPFATRIVRRAGIAIVAKGHVARKDAGSALADLVRARISVTAG